MATTQAEPDQDSWKQQQDRQDRTKRTKRIGGFAAAIVSLGVLALILITMRSGGDMSTPDPAAAPAIGEGEPPPSAETTNGYLLDLETGEATPLPANIPETKYDVSPDGTQITYDADPDSDSKIVVANMDGSDIREFSFDGKEVRGPAWSPGGSMIVYLGIDQTDPDGPGNLYLLDIATGDSSQITDLPQTPVMLGSYLSPSFSQKGDTVYFQYPRGATQVRDLWSVPITGEEPTLVRRRAAYGEVSPDGTQIAFLRSTTSDPWAGEGIEIVGTLEPDAEPRTLVNGGSIQWQRWSPDGTRIAYADREGSDPGVYVADVANGETTRVGDGTFAGWVDDQTLIVSR